MRGLGARHAVNLGWLVVVSAVVVVGAAVRWVGPAVLGETYELRVAVPEAGGVMAGQPVTVLGTEVGTVRAVELTDEAVDLVLAFDRTVDVPRDAVAQVLRRSPIGEQALELTPVAPDWRPPADVVPSRVPVDPDWVAAPPGTRIEPRAVVVPSSVPALLDRAHRLLSAIDGDDLDTVVGELGTALSGRTGTVRQLNRDAVAVGETLVAAIPDTERLLAASGPVLAALREHREALAAGLADTADVVETLAAARPDAEALLTDLPPTLGELDRLVRAQRPNLHCLGRDLLDLGELVAGTDNLAALERLLDLNRYFYGGFDAGTQWDAFRPGVIWARVNILLMEEARGRSYPGVRPTPATRPGARCASPFGPGVDAVRQLDPRPPDPSSPGVEYAPLVRDHAATRAGVR